MPYLLRGNFKKKRIKKEKQEEKNKERKARGKEKQEEKNRRKYLYYK